MKDDTVSVVSLLPFWRYAVGPVNSHANPAIPFYRKASAQAFFETACRELPFSDIQMIKRVWGGVDVIQLRKGSTPNLNEIFNGRRHS